MMLNGGNRLEDSFYGEWLLRGRKLKAKVPRWPTQFQRPSIGISPFTRNHFLVGTLWHNSLILPPRPQNWGNTYNFLHKNSWSVKQESSFTKVKTSEAAFSTNGTDLMSKNQMEVFMFSLDFNAQSTTFKYLLSVNFRLRPMNLTDSGRQNECSRFYDLPRVSCRNSSF